MKKFAQRLWTEEDGVLTFEWILLVTLLTIGIVGGIAGARDAIIDELGDVAQAMLALDQSYNIASPLQFDVHNSESQGASNSAFVDYGVFTECNRNPQIGGNNQGDILSRDIFPDGA